MQLFTSEKEAAALLVALENYLNRYKESATAEIVAPVVDRIYVCLEKQGRKK